MCMSGGGGGGVAGEAGFTGWLPHLGARMCGEIIQLLCGSVCSCIHQITVPSSQVVGTNAYCGGELSLVSGTR